MKPILKCILANIVIIAVFCGSLFPLGVYAENTYSDKQKESFTDLAVERFTAADEYRNGISINAADILLNGKSVSSEFEFSKNDEITFSVTVAEPGEYTVACEYYAIDAEISDCIIKAEATDQNINCILPILWKDAQANYEIDRDGNEIPASQEAVKQYVFAPFTDYSDLNRGDATFKLSSGKNDMRFLNLGQKLKIKGFYLKKSSESHTYSEYIGKIDAENGADFCTLEAEKYALKTNPSVVGASVRSIDLTPYDTYYQRINVLDGWSASGDKVLYEFEVNNDGLYQIAFHYKQNADTNMTVYRSMQIDGSALFEEMNCIAFPPTKSNTFSNYVFEVDGKPAYIYLEKGRHVLSLTATMGPLADKYQEILDLMTEVNNFGIKINKLAASNTDANRTWDTEAYIPDAVPTLKGFAQKANEIYNEICNLSSVEPVYANDLKYAAELLNDIAAVPRTIPNKADDICMGDSSVSKFLGSVIAKLVNQSLTLDKIYISGSADIPKPNASIWVKIWEAIKQFVHSYTYDNSSNSGDKEEKSLKVWMSRSIPYVQILQQLTDRKYNSVYNTNVEVTVMSGEQKLILSNAAGTNPDVVIGVSYSTPFNLAVRGAAKNLLEYDDFLQFYNSEYNLEALIPMCYGDGVYGATDTQDFNILFYRSDILKTLGIDVPETWMDVKAMMPQLLRYNMNFYLPLSSGGAMKSMAVTGPFIYQNNAAFYENDGMKVAFDENNGINAFKEMTSLYKIYGAQKAVANFYNSFRYGEIPIGISGFATYLQLETAAPELVGRWGVALVPGEKQADGSVLRYQMADSTAVMILKNNKNSEGAWQFLKWWLSSDTQLEYSEMLQTTYGKAYRWNTANLKAFEHSTYPDEHKNIILQQWKSQKENVSHVASYMVERETSNIWNNVVVNGEGLIESIDSSAIISNREIKRKMQEFGFCDSKGKIVKSYSVGSYAKLLEKLKGEK